jgi:hypothetical protein
MTTSSVAQLIEQRNPQLSPLAVARVTSLMVASTDTPESLMDPEYFRQQWDQAQLRLWAANEQHEAVKEELEALAKSDPRLFSPDQIWILIRAIKVQSQLLKMHVGDPIMENTQTNVS